jgi:hypothetical protein
MKTISIHQPSYLPWLSYFKKMMDSDIFVFLDDVQYEKNGWQNRNKIRTNNGSVWLTVPVTSQFGTKLNEIKIDKTSNWLEKHKKSLLINYSKSKYFKDIWQDLEPIYEQDYELLIQINMKIIEFIMKKLQIQTKTIFSSELNIKETGSNRILNICKKLNADVYLSGKGLPGNKYLIPEDFLHNNILIKYLDFQHPTYHQLYEPFLPNLSTIDLLFNAGCNSSKYFQIFSNS